MNGGNTGVFKKNSVCSSTRNMKTEAQPVYKIRYNIRVIG